MHTISVNPGEDVAARRRALGISQTKLAVHAGRSPAYVGLIEQGYRPKTGSGLADILAALTTLETSNADGGSSALQTSDAPLDHDEG